MEIGLTATVVGPDGDTIGRVRFALVDPRTSLLSHVVVAEGGDSADQRAIPLWAIERGEADEVFLKEDAPAVDSFPLYRREGRRTHGRGQVNGGFSHEPGDFPSLFPEDGSLPRDAVALSEGAVITCHEGGHAGTVVAIEADDYTAELTLLYSRLDGEPHRIVAVPIAWARSFTAGKIVLECTQGDLATLPAYDTGSPESTIEPLQQG